MASFLSSPRSALLPHPTTRSQDPHPPPNSPIPISFPLRSIATQRRRRAAVLVAGKRYKGTAMREARLAEMIETKVAEAMEVCDGEDGRDSDGCRVAWDEVEEVSQAKAHLRRRIAEGAADPLEPFCSENPETDECSVYED